MAPSIDAVPVPVRPPLTVNALPAGAEPAFSGSLKNRVRFRPSTVAPVAVGLLTSAASVNVTARSLKFTTEAPYTDLSDPSIPWPPARCRS